MISCPTTAPRIDSWPACTTVSCWSWAWAPTTTWSRFLAADHINDDDMAAAMEITSAAAKEAF
jgi:hypothetical protein